jgi:hypothetical protein
MTVLLHVTPDGFRHLPDIEQFTARNQLCPAMVGGAIHVDDFRGVGQGIVKVIKKFFRLSSELILRNFNK